MDRFSEKDDKAQFFFHPSLLNVFFQHCQDFPPLKLLNKVSFLAVAAVVVEQVLGSS